MITGLPLIIIGSGGHARVLADALLSGPDKIIGYTDPCPADQSLPGLAWLGDDQCLSEHPADSVLLVNGIGSVGSMERRCAVYDKFKKLGYHFAKVVHPTAIISSGATLAEGTQVLAGAIIQVAADIGANTIINTKASVDHDCVIGDHCHLAPGVTLSGGVHVGNGTHIGTGAVVIQGVHIGQNCTIGAGAVVLKDVPDGTTFAGVPAKRINY